MDNASKNNKISQVDDLFIIIEKSRNIKKFKKIKNINF